MEQMRDRQHAIERDWIATTNGVWAAYEVTHGRAGERSSGGMIKPYGRWT